MLRKIIDEILFYYWALKVCIRHEMGRHFIFRDVPQNILEQMMEEFEFIASADATDVDKRTQDFFNQMEEFARAADEELRIRKIRPTLGA